MDTNENNNPNDPTPSPVPPPAPQVPPTTPPVGAPPPVIPPPASMLPGDFTKDEKMWAMLSHLTSLSGYLIVPFGNVLAPLIIWLIKKDTMPFVDDQAKESLNFQITLTIGMLVSAILTLVCVGYFLLLGLWI